MRGASALELALGEHRDVPLGAFVVWERVLWTDWAAPAAGVLARLPDPRAIQFWDRGRLLSDHLRAAHGKGGTVLPDIVWDVVAIYPKGARWEQAIPPALFFDGTVVEVMAAFKAALAVAIRE